MDQNQNQFNPINPAPAPSFGPPPEPEDKVVNSDGSSPSIMKHAFPEAPAAPAPPPAAPITPTPTSFAAPTDPAPLPPSSPAPITAGSSPLGGDFSLASEPSRKRGVTKRTLDLPIISLILSILFITLLSGINVWIKLIILLAVSTLSLVVSLKAYKREATSASALMAVIISTMVLIGTLVIGSVYLYFYIQLKAAFNSF